MKNLPAFIETYINNSNLSVNQTKEIIRIISSSNQLPSYSDKISWYVGKEEITYKPSFYSLPMVLAGKFCSWGGKNYNEKSTKNLFHLVVRSDFGINAPLHIAKESKSFLHLNEFEKLVLSFENFDNPTIFFSKDMAEFFASLTHKSGNFELLITGSFNEKFSTNFYIRNYFGMVTKLGRNNRHTLNHSLKLVEQLNEIEQQFETSERQVFRYMEQLETVKGSFDQFYSWIFLKGKSTKDLKGRSAGKYNQMKGMETEKVQTLKDFFLICCGFDKILINNIPEKVIVQSSKKNYITVSKYAKKHIKQLQEIDGLI